MTDRTLSQADIDAIAQGVIECMRRRPQRSQERGRPDQAKVECVMPGAGTLPVAGHQACLANASNVRPENAEFQALPKPMINALLACHARGPLR